MIYFIERAIIMKDCVTEAYDYYCNPLNKECDKEFYNLPILFGKKKKEDAIREKYLKQGLKVMRYEDIRYSQGLSELSGESRGGLKACATFVGYGHYICCMDNLSVEGCECCKINNDCGKLQDFLWSDLYD